MVLVHEWRGVDGAALGRSGRKKARSWLSLHVLESYMGRSLERREVGCVK